ncbi:unnamed protein product [Chrysoparadoxa australica]
MAPAPPIEWCRVTDLYSAGTHLLENQKDVVAVKHKLCKAAAMSGSSPGDIQDITALQELMAVVLLLIFPGGLLWVPCAIFAALYFSIKHSLAMVVITIVCWAALTFWPLSRWPGFMHCWIAPLLFRYSSMSTSSEDTPNPNRKYVMIMPPHGVLPWGNLLMLAAFQNIWGYNIMALTTDAALRQASKCLKHFFASCIRLHCYC